MLRRPVHVLTLRRHQRWQDVITGLLWGLLLVAVAYATLCGYVALRLTAGTRAPFERSPDQYGLAYEPVSFPSRDSGITLDGWLVARGAGTPQRRPVIVAHGRGIDRQSELGGGIMDLAGHLTSQGHPVLLFDQRGHGRSGGERTTLGAREAHDVRGAIDFLDRRSLAVRGVNLLGYSMGAAAALLAAVSDPRVRAVATDSAYASLVEILQDQIPRISPLPPWCAPGTIFMAWPLLGGSPYAVRPVEGMPALAARGTPVLVIHGHADTIVPIDHARRLAAAYGPQAETLFVPSAGHVASYAADPHTYLTRLAGFFARAE